MIPLWAAGALLGIGKSALIDVPNQAKDAELQATTAALSPWTGLQAKEVQRANPIGDAMQGGLAGYDMEQKQKDKAFQKKLLTDQLALDQQLAGQQMDWLNLARQNKYIAP